MHRWMVRHMSKFYAVREGRQRGVIVESWDECKALVHGVTSEYKSFPTRGAANEYLRAGVLAKLGPLPPQYAAHAPPSSETVSVPKPSSVSSHVNPSKSISQPVTPFSQPHTPLFHQVVPSKTNSQEVKINPFGPSLLPTDVVGRRIPSTGFGKVGTRTTAQRVMALHEASELLLTFGADEVVCFTDGACAGNPGPCGAGAWIKFADKVYEQSAALGKGTNNIGELYAVGMAMDMILEAKEQGQALPPGTKINVLTDSKYTKGMLALGFQAKSNQELIHAVQQKLAAVCEHNPVFIHWVAGHSGLHGNEHADKLALQGARNSEANIGIVPQVCYRPVAKKRRMASSPPPDSQVLGPLDDDSEGEVMGPLDGSFENDSAS